MKYSLSQPKPQLNSLYEGCRALPFRAFLSMASNMRSNGQMQAEETSMYIHKSNAIVELTARFRYWYLRNVKQAEPIDHIEYRNRHWYKFDRHSKVVKISLTYFELMQPYYPPQLRT